MTEPAWLAHASTHIGLREIPGPKHNPTIVKWLVKLKAWWMEDETPWCGTFVAHCFDAVSIKPTKHWYRAKDWLNWGVSVPPRLGVVAVFDRKGGGHVGFLVGETATHYAVLGGNQGNAVNVMNLQKNRLLGCRWPVGVAKSPVMPLPRLAGIIGNGNEA
jgi:uncharacterized protein (TIGR02594 family)